MFHVYLKAIFALKNHLHFFSCRMGIFFVQPILVLHCPAKTLLIILETVAPGDQPAFRPQNSTAIVLLDFKCDDFHKSEYEHVCVWTGVSSVNMSPNCTWMDRGSPPGQSRVFTATALWVPAGKRPVTQSSSMLLWLDATQLYESFQTEILITTASKWYCIYSQRQDFLICVYLLGRWGVVWACGLIVSHPTLQPSSYTRGRVLSYLSR